MEPIAYERSCQSFDPNPQDLSATTALEKSTSRIHEIDSEQLSIIYKALNGQDTTYNCDVIAPYASSQKPYFAGKNIN